MPSAIGTILCAVIQNPGPEKFQEVRERELANFSALKAWGELLFLKIHPSKRLHLNILLNEMLTTGLLSAD